MQQSEWSCLAEHQGGGSTITQQLAKNAYLTLDQTFDRKAKELFLAIEIEKKYSKEEILTMYLNNAYFGNGVWGVQDASRKYFGVDATNVTLSEAATLAGMLKGPGIYNPIDHPKMRMIGKHSTKCNGRKRKNHKRTRTSRKPDRYQRVS